jgi:hypothetical protein
VTCSTSLIWQTCRSEGIRFFGVEPLVFLPEGLRIPQAARKAADGRITDGPALAELRGLLDDLARAVAGAREDSGALAS